MKQNYNNESLARLGHGKWKSALGHTLLIIGMVLMSLGVYAQEATGGLYMHKEWVPDLVACPNGDCGHIRLETFVTGESMVVDAHIPTDIVVVVDQSGSMMDDFSGNSTNTNANRKVTALKNALTTFLSTVQQDAKNNNCTHKIAIVGFGMGSEGGSTYPNSVQVDAYHNTELLTPSEIGYLSITEQNYKDALLLANVDNDVNPALTSAVANIDARGATYMQYGLIMAKNILANRTETTFVDNNGDTHDRAKVVVFFTDGYPGSTYYGNGQYFNEGYFNNGTYYDNATEADAAVEQANQIKTAGTTIFTVGIYTGADPNAAYRTTRSTSYYNGYYWSTGTASANGLMHFISSDYAAGEATSWQNLTTSNQNSANKFENSKFMSASDASQLENVFGQIAQQSGGAAITMGVETVVQDVISPDFKLDIPATGDAIKAYAPKCTGKDGNNLLFDEINDNGTLVLSNGVVTSGSENRLPNSIIKYVNYDEQGNLVVDDYGNPIYSETPTKYIRITGFNFDEMWCGKKTDHGQTTYQGRKLVLIIPIEIDGNTWGDGIETNGPVSVILPNGDELTPIEFNKPTADVVGEVWTEVVTDKPGTFDATADPIPLTTPEDLAWFISYVNGRKGYDVNPVETTHPSANAILMADIDMSAHNWVPIGMNAIDGTVLSYTGTFDGNGHVITGLKNNAGKKFMNSKVSWVFPGMFNKVGDGGVVKNVFVLDADFRGQQRKLNNKECFVHHGIIADSLLAGGKIFNCEAAGRITCNNKNPETDVNLIFGGLVGLNQGTVHSCMAMAELTAYTMGGMIGENGKGNTNGSFTNGFTNGVYHYLGKTGTGAENKPVGGIAGINKSGSTISNCYVRFSRDENTNLENTTQFGRIVGNGEFDDESCYSPMYAILDTDGNLIAVPGNVPMAGHGIQYSTTCSPSLMREAQSNDNMVSDNASWPVWGSVTTSAGLVPLLQGGTPLLDKLNAGKGTGASWKRTTAGGYATSPNGGNINGDYPILEFTDFNCVASADGIRLDYAASLDEMLDRHNAGNMNVGTAMPLTETNSWYTAPEHATTYTVTASPAIYGGAINLYDNDANVTKSTSTTAKTMVYIDENVSLLQGNTTSSLDAYTCQTLKSFSTAWPSGGGERWHYISSSLDNSKFGWTYHNDADFNWEPNPCDIWFELENDDEAIVPTDARSWGVLDFYCFYEPQYHWLNFRRNSNSHYHMDGNHAKIDYVNELGEDGNEDHFIPGKGYLMALSTEYFNDHYTYAGEKKHAQFLQNRGTLTNGEFTIPVTYTPINDLDGYKTGLEGCNLLGNPYQSYLDFDAFTTVNSGLWSEGDTYGKTYAIYDPKTDNYIEYIGGSSNGALVADRFINMHQGFLIKVSNGGNAIFNNDMRTNNPGENYPGFRGEKPAYPLINFILNDNDGNTDIAVLECNRPENDGAKKLRVGNPAGRIYFRYDNENLAIYFRNSEKDYQTLNFAAEEDGNFTLNWNTANADFRTLTLVDNITGIKTDMLTHDHYTFEGRVDDYNTRFKIVFGEMDNNEEEPVLEHFAFFNQGNLIVNGTGHFEVVDVLGRVVYATELTDTQNTVSLPSNVRGVCMLCFTRNNETKVQKMVIQ
jgi:hypothetical protein